MYDLAVLEATFGVEEKAKPDEVGAAFVPQPGSTDQFERRFRSLMRASGGKYEHCLNGNHDYASDSEATMAVVGRHG